MLRPAAALAAALLVVALGSTEDVTLDETSLMQTNIDPRLANSTQLAMTNPVLQTPSTFQRDYTSDQGAAPTTQAPATAVKDEDRFAMKNVVAEYIAMTLFVIIGCGSAMAIAKEPHSAWVLEVALVFGFAITALAYSLGRYSGGQINCAVTLALWVYGSLSWEQALFNFIGQMLGSITGAIILCIIFPKEMDKTESLGSNGISPGFTTFGTLLGEFLMTFLLVITVFESGHVADPASGIAVICIGLAVFLAHCVLIPIDGCSINPTRSFGPALIATFRTGKAATFKDMWVFWVGPCLGALAAAGVHKLFRLAENP